MAVASIYEPIMNALLALLKAQCGATFASYSRRLIVWEEFTLRIQNNSPVPRQPCLFLYDGIGFGGGRVKYDPRGRGTPGVRTLFRTIVVYAQLPGGDTPGGIDQTTAGGTVFAPLVEAIENAFNATDSEGALTLGGLVSHCWLEGDGHWSPGDIDPHGQGMLTVPVAIMIP